MGRFFTFETAKSNMFVCCQKMDLPFSISRESGYIYGKWEVIFVDLAVKVASASKTQTWSSKHKSCLVSMELFFADLC